MKRKPPVETSRNCPDFYFNAFRRRHKQDNARLAYKTTPDHIVEFFVGETLSMERVGQILIEDVTPNWDFLVILYRPLDKGKSKEIWHIVAIRDRDGFSSDRWHAADGWWYSPYMKPRNKRDRRQLLLF